MAPPGRGHGASCQESPVRRYSAIPKNCAFLANFFSARSAPLRDARAIGDLMARSAAPQCYTGKSFIFEKIYLRNFLQKQTKETKKKELFSDVSALRFLRFVLFNFLV